MTDILAALNKSKEKNKPVDTGKQDRVMIDGMLSICDEVFELELCKLGVDHNIINERLRETV
jgi:hypothetical protein